MENQIIQKSEKTKIKKPECPGTKKCKGTGKDVFHICSAYSMKKIIALERKVEKLELLLLQEKEKGVNEYNRGFVAGFASVTVITPSVDSSVKSNQKKGFLGKPENCMYCKAKTCTQHK